MNLLILASLALALLGVLWLAQWAAVRWAGEGHVWALPFRHGSDSQKIRGVMKLALGASVVALLAGYPLLIGEDPIQYHVDKLTPPRFGLALKTLLAVFGAFAALFAVSVAVGWIHFEKRHDTSRLALKVLKGLWAPLPLTLMEEPLFRGLVLEQLAAEFAPWLAVILSAAIFAAVHFLRPQKRPLLAAVGLFYVGLALGASYLLAGHNYLLPVAVHAAGVLFIQVTRPVCRYVGPAWLIGRSSYPIAGVLNMAAVTVAFVLVMLM
jgi:membrane protease YdiL (CAAX protease family)